MTTIMMEIEMPAFNIKVINKDNVVEEIIRMGKVLDEAAVPHRDYYIPVHDDSMMNSAWKNWLEEHTARMVRHEAEVQEAMIHMELKRLELDCNPKMILDRVGEFKQWK